TLAVPFHRRTEEHSAKFIGDQTRAIGTGLDVERVKRAAVDVIITQAVIEDALGKLDVLAADCHSNSGLLTVTGTRCPPTVVGLSTATSLATLGKYGTAWPAATSASLRLSVPPSAKITPR